MPAPRAASPTRPAPGRKPSAHATTPACADGAAHHGAAPHRGGSMRRSIPLLATLLSVLALVLSAVPAAALSPFGGVVEIHEPDCRPATFVTDAAMGTDGVLRGFVSAPLGGCQENPVIRYFEKDGSSVTGVSTPYR